MAIYIFKDGNPEGPIEESVVRFHLAHGILSKDDYGWREGLPDWVPLRELFTLARNPPVFTVQTQKSIFPRRTISAMESW